MTKTHKRLIWLLVKIVVGAGLIIFVGKTLLKRWTDVKGTIGEAFHQHPGYLVLGLLVFVGVYVLGNVRWIILLRPHGVGISFWAASKLWFIGHFFAQYMPGGIAGGDLVKSYYIATHSTAVGRRAEAVSTVFLDRFLGIIGLIGVLLIAVVVNLHQSPAYRRYWLYALIGLAASAVLILLLFNKALLKKLPLVMRLYARLPYRDKVKRVYDAFHFYRTRPWEITWSLLLSLVVHMTTALEAYLFGLALGLPYTYPEYMLLLSLTNFVASIPVSPVGNLGTLETACVLFFSRGDPQLEGPALALAILIRMAYLLWGIPGLILYVTHRKEIPHEPVEQTVEVIEHDAPAPLGSQIKEVAADD
jgi:uncharacterized protein (TIRG00374 family)